MPANDDLINGWVSTDCGRGTSDILWSCLATILLCVWTAIHLPVPLYHGQRPLSIQEKLVGSRTIPALISIIAPEYLAITAVAELTASWLGKGEIKRLTQIDWTLTHQFFLDMGGICLKSPSGRYQQIGKDEVIKAMKSSRSHDNHQDDPSDWISELEKLTEDQIKEVAKSDTLSKLIACGQALWLATQVVSRLYQHRAVTLLEVSTCAYVSCALLSYAAWWKKPQGCTSPIIITCSAEAMSEICSGSFKGYYSEIQVTWKALFWAGRHWSKFMDAIDTNNFMDLGYNVFLGLTALCPTLFGAIHVASWNTRLPSGVELWMWRGSSIYCLTAGVVFAIAVNVLADVLGGSQRLRDWYEDVLTYFIFAFLPLVYIIVRIYMIVEVFLSLRALPRSAFESVQWSSFIPHV